MVGIYHQKDEKSSLFVYVFIYLWPMPICDFASNSKDFFTELHNHFAANESQYPFSSGYAIGGSRSGWSLYQLS